MLLKQECSCTFGLCSVWDEKNSFHPGLMNKLCFYTGRILFCLTTEETVHVAISAFISHSVSAALICPRLRTGCHTYTTHTNAPTALVFCHVGCSVSRDQGASGQLLGSLSGQLNVSSAKQSKTFCRTPFWLSCHLAPPASVTGNPAAVQELCSGNLCQSDCGGGWGMRRHPCWESGRWKRERIWWVTSREAGMRGMKH